jgi:iron complex outermembrane receptor protein
MSFKHTLLATAIASLPLTLYAADQTMSDVIVKSSKDATAATSTAVEKSALQSLRSATNDTATLIRDVPGVSFQGSGGVSSLPIIHGLADDRLRVKVDGMDLLSACPNHMNPALSYLDPSQVSAIKVYAGLAPVSVGGDSIGGSIVAETLPPKFAAPGQGSLFTGEVGAFYRSNGNAYGGNLAATYATESFNISYTGTTAKSDNYDAGGNFKESIYGTSTASPTVTGRVGHTLPLDEVGSTAYETRNHTLGVAFKGGNHLFEAKFGYQDLPYQLWPNQRMDMLANEQNRMNLRYLGAFDWGSLEARVYHEEVDHFMDFGADKRYWYGNGAPPTGSGGPAAPNGMACAPTGTATCATGMPMYTASTNTGVTVKGEINLSQQDLLRTGIELQRYTLDDWWPASGGGMMPNTFWNINNGERDRNAVYGEWEKRLSPQWQTLLGVRYEHVSMDAGPVQAYNNAVAPATTLVPAFNNSDRSRTDNNWDLTALAHYTPSANYDIEFGFARKMRSPNLHERYSWYSRGMEMLMINWLGEGNGYIGNRDLNPEKSHTLSATFDWHAADRTWEFKATPYYTHVDDYIDAVRCPTSLGGSCTAANLTNTNTFVFLQFANHSARLYGLDLSGKMPLGKTGFGDFGLKGLLSYTNGKNRDTDDGLYNIMPLNAKLTLTQKFGGWDNAIELVMVKSKNDVSDVRNELETSGYNLVNLRGSYSWKQVRVDFGVENLFDKLYNLPLGGAYMGQGTTMTATTNATGAVPVWGTAVPGMGRSLYAGVNYKF